jgi:hypothetical protein
MNKNKITITISAIILLLLISAWCSFRRSEWTQNPPQMFIIYLEIAAKWIIFALLGYLATLFFSKHLATDKRPPSMIPATVHRPLTSNLLGMIKAARFSLTCHLSSKEAFYKSLYQIILSYVPFGFLTVMGYQASIFQTKSPEIRHFNCLKDLKDWSLAGLKISLLIASLILPGLCLLRHSIMVFDTERQYNALHSLYYLLGSALKPLLFTLAPGHYVVMDKSLQISTVAGLFSLLLGLFLIPAALIALQTKDRSTGHFISEIQTVINGLKGYYFLGLFFTYGSLILFVWILWPFPPLYPLTISIYGGSISCFWHQLLTTQPCLPPEPHRK